MRQAKTMTADLCSEGFRKVLGPVLGHFAGNMTVGPLYRHDCGWRVDLTLDGAVDIPIGLGVVSDRSGEPEPLELTYRDDAAHTEGEARLLRIAMIDALATICPHVGFANDADATEPGN